MKSYNKYAELGLAAMKRAAEQARKEAAILGIKIPVWRNNKIVYVDLSEDSQQSRSADKTADA